MRRSSGGNWALEKYNPVPGVMEAAPASKGYTGGFGTDLMLKDLELAQENATEVRAATPLLLDGGVSRPVIDRVYAFDEVNEKVAYAQMGWATGWPL